MPFYTGLVARLALSTVFSKVKQTLTRGHKPLVVSPHPRLLQLLRNAVVEATAAKLAELSRRSIQFP